jgi:uncharacterized membrane protein (UPF0182 family)
MKGIPVKRITAIALLIILLAAIIIFSGIYIDYIELSEIGDNFTEVFWRNFNVNTITFLASFLVFFTLILSNMLILRNNLLGIDTSFSYLKKVTPIVIVSMVLAMFLAEYARRLIADTFLPFLTSEWFNLGDPVFHQDVGYYVFQRPFYIAVLNALLSLSVFLIFLTALSYIILYARFDFYNLKNLFKKKSIVLHEIISVVIFFLVKAVSYRYQAENILFRANEEFVGGCYIDINVWIQYYRLLPVLLVIIAAAAIVFTLNSKYMHAVASALMYPVSFVIVMLVAQVMQTLVVAPDELAVEASYMQNNINFTREAYGLDKVENREFKVEYNLTGKDIMNNLGIINNIRLIDFSQTIKTANQIQAIRNYYQFTDTDIVPYDINGQTTAVAISAREITTDRLDDAAKNYINTTLRYTHGMGVVMNPVNTVTEQGQPYFIIRDIPPRSLDGAPEIIEPRIYFGEHMKDYVIVGTRDKELDELLPGGYTYNGNAGIELTFFKRLIYAFKYSDFKILISDQINKNSRLLTNRRVLERVQKAAPFLTFDSDVYILVDNAGRLKWVVDGYTSTQWFPYSQYSGEINYIRNSVKAVVDAYNGTVKFYVFDENDPIIRSYRRIYPTLFEQLPFPKDLSEHLRYPKTLFKIQAEMLRRYHIDNAADFYEKKGVWAYPKEKFEGDKDINMEPYYTLMKMPGEKQEAFVLMQPYTPTGRPNMVSWLAAQSSGGNYGRLILYRLVPDENVYGPYQIENRIDNDASISKELSQWRQSGSSVIRGNLLVIPVNNSILYVEPIYISSGESSGQIPEVRKIIVAYGEKVVAKATLDEALNALFGVSRPTVIATNEETIREVISKVVESYDEMVNYSKEGDWENYGKALKELEINIQILREKNKEEEEKLQIEENFLTEE